MDGRAANVAVDSNPDQGLELPEITACTLAYIVVLAVNPVIVPVRSAVMELEIVPVNVLAVLICNT